MAGKNTGEEQLPQEMVCASSKDGALNRRVFTEKIPNFSTRLGTINGERIKGSDMKHTQHRTEIPTTVVDGEMFAAALALKHIQRLLIHGGSDTGRPDGDDALHPCILENVLAYAIQLAQQTKHLEDEWQQLYQILPRIQEAWEGGQTLFRYTSCTQQEVRKKESICLISTSRLTVMPRVHRTKHTHRVLCFKLGSSMDICRAGDSIFSPMKKQLHKTVF